VLGGHINKVIFQDYQSLTQNLRVWFWNMWCHVVW